MNISFLLLISDESVFSRGSAAATGRVLRRLEDECRPEDRVEVLLLPVGQDPGADAAASLTSAWRAQHPRLTFAYSPPSLADEPWARVLPQADWVGFLEPSRPPQPGMLRRARTRLTDSNSTRPSVWCDTLGDPTPTSPTHSERLPGPAHLSLMRKDALPGSVVHVRRPFRPEWSSELLLWEALLRPGSTLSFAGETTAGWDGREEPPEHLWLDPSTYAEFLDDGLHALLQRSAAAPGGAPHWLQACCARTLYWYFVLDQRSRTPTARVDATRADTLHRLIGRLVKMLAPAAIKQGCGANADQTAVEALLSYSTESRMGEPELDRYDIDQQLARVTYVVQGPLPKEHWAVDGHRVRPAFEKLRSYNFFRRTLFMQRIAWIPMPASACLELHRRPQDADEGSQVHRLSTARLKRAGHGSLRPSRTMPSENTRNSVDILRWIKTRALWMLALLPPYRMMFRDAWIFIDREDGADDNAEHLYRWVQMHHPEVNAWFALNPGSADWARLKAEGFRLVPPGRRSQIAALCCSHIVSSHTDWLNGWLDPKVHGERMAWRVSFLQHGVIKDDLSHWLGAIELDCFLTTGPQEHASIVASGSPYPFTDREVRQTGLPRHDRLVTLDRALRPLERRSLLVMPTWRQSLMGGHDTAPMEQQQARIASSEYVQRWRNVLGDPALRSSLHGAGLRLVFLPHANALPFLDAFEIDNDVEVQRPTGGGLQQLFARSVGLVTDYTSVAFEFALLRRQVFYFQFDHETFFSGGHFLRPGYFSYERDGFGPVHYSERSLVDALRRFVDRGCTPDPQYLARMQAAIPDADGGACARAFDAICQIREPKTSWHSDALQ